MNAALGTRGRYAVTQGEAQSVITCGLFTASLNAATSCGLFPRLKPLQAAFLARTFCEKMVLPKKSKGSVTSSNVFPS